MPANTNNSLFDLKSELQCAHKTLEAVAAFVIENKKPSQWSSRGVGWQEHIKDARHAGFYASCEGLEILFFANHAALKSFVRKTFDEHLCRILKNEPEERRAALANERELVFKITFKLAEFLNASALLAEHVAHQRRPINQAVRRLLTYQLHDCGSWPNVEGHVAPSAAATAECLRAVSRFDGKHARQSQAAIRFLQNILESRSGDALTSTNCNDVILACWGLSEVQALLRPKVLRRVTDAIETLLISDPEVYAHRCEEKFLIGTVGEYYQHNRLALIATTALNLIACGHMARSRFSLLIPLVVQIAANLSANRAFVSPLDQKMFFWELHQNVRVLDRFIRTFENRGDLAEEKYMFVKPTVFKTEGLKQDDKLCVVLMPMKKDWSNDVYKTFRQAVRRKKFNVWRADTEARATAIIEDIWKRIYSARFVIADCTTRNPNVFYELGIAHALGKKVFICAQDRKDFPFDIQHLRNWAYGAPRPGSLNDLKREIHKFIEDDVLRENDD
jgi:hypothetical protein